MKTTFIITCTVQLIKRVEKFTTIGYCHLFQKINQKSKANISILWGLSPSLVVMETSHVRKVEGSNSGAVYWIDISLENNERIAQFNS